MDLKGKIRILFILLRGLKNYKMENNNMLAKISLGINAVLIIAVIALFVKMPGGEGGAEGDEIAEGDSTKVLLPDDGKLTIAFFNSDSLTNNLLFVKDLEAEVQASQLRAEEKMLKKQREIDAWNKKWEKKGQLLPREQEKYMMEAQQMQQDAAMFEQQVQMELAQEQEMLMLTHFQRVSNFSKDYAENNNIDMVFSYQLGQNMVYCNPNMDVTSELIKVMNEDYNETFAEDGEEASEE
jgi:outer membrane protein